MSQSFNKKRNNRLYVNKDNFIKIIQFYLFETPVESLSKRGISFKKYGWEFGHRYKVLKNKLINLSIDSEIDFHCYDNKNKLKEKLCEFADIKSNAEFCIYYKVDSNSEIRSLFRIIRNSLAHGEFVIRKYNKEVMYYFENYSTGGKSNGELFLKEKKLLKWIDLVKKGQVE